MTVPIHRRQVQGGGFGRQQRPGNGGMPIAQRLQFDLVALILLFGEQDQAQQGVGHATARRQHHSEAPVWLRLQNVGHAHEAVGVRDA